MAEVIDLGDAPNLDRSTLVQAVYDYLDANMPGGYTPRTGRLDDLIINAEGQQASEIVALLSRFGNGVFRYYGLNVAKVDPIEALPAEGTTTWTVADTDGHTIPAGTEISVDGVGFETTQDAVIPEAASEVAGVPIVGQTPGELANGLSSNAVVRDNLSVPYVVTVDAPTGGGQDAEGDDAYLVRLVEELQLLSRVAVTADDLAKLARRVAGVGRVLVLNLHNGDTNADNQPACATIILTDEAGQATAAPVKAAVLALFSSGRRLLPVELWAKDADYHVVDVDVTVRYWPGFEPATVVAQVQERVAALLNPLTWGSPQQGEGSDENWVNDKKVTLYQLAGAIEQAEGVQRVKSGTLEINAAAADYDMAGVAPLPTVGAVNVATELAA